MKVEETTFETEHPSGGPLMRDVLRHNAYVVGWEHGAVDHHPKSSYWEVMRELGCESLYEKGREDGKRARSCAWKKVRRSKEPTDAHRNPSSNV